MREAQWQVESPEKFKIYVILGGLLKVAAGAHACIEMFSFFKC